MSTAVSLVNNGGAAVAASFDLPSFTLVANPGYVLTGTLVSTLGNPAYAEFNGSTCIALLLAGLGVVGLLARRRQVR